VILCRRWRRPRHQREAFDIAGASAEGYESASDGKQTKVIFRTDAALPSDSTFEVVFHNKTEVVHAEVTILVRKPMVATLKVLRAVRGVPKSWTFEWGIANAEVALTGLVDEHLKVAVDERSLCAVE
jgi:hypothetical protein